MKKVIKVQHSDLEDSKNPVFAYCRKLISEGEKPNTVLETYRGEVLCLRMKIKDGAETSVREPESRTGNCQRMHFAKYDPWWEKQGVAS